MQKFMVGGAVRDRLLGLEPKDVDYVVVGATPEEMLAQGFKQVGADFPVFLDADGTEYALARTERKTGRGYNGFDTDASPTVTLEQDLERRDLTINAMAFQPGDDFNVDGLFDPFGGQADLRDKVLRHVSPAFADDPVRVLRLARFHARYGPEWSVAGETMEFARQMVEAGELAFLTRERVLMELEKALGEQAPHLFFKTLHEVGALQVVFPELTPPDGRDTQMLELVLRLGKSRSARFNWAKVSTMVESPESFETRLNVSTHWRAFSKMFRGAVSLQYDNPVDMLHAMDAYRQRDLWEAVMVECHEAKFRIGFLEEAYHATKHVCFETLPETVQATAKGKEISEAIKQQRMFAYESSQSKK